MLLLNYMQVNAFCRHISIAITKVFDSKALQNKELRNNAMGLANLLPAAESGNPYNS